ncbi:MAG: hypothetical protein JO256_02640 [Alphaproteobacteria bacterium]|nr:hypothetical protein [Alphaproteobacteria bacterium]
MTEIGFQYAVGALTKKRAELAGEIGQLELTLRDRRLDLAKVDDVLQLLAPGKDPSAIPPKKPIKYLNVFRQGELGRLIIGLLRSSDKPMTNLDIARAIFDRGAFEPNLWTAINRRCRANLAYLEAQGRVMRLNRGVAAKWALVHRQE